MTLSVPQYRPLLSVVLGLLSGILFSFIVGSLDTPDYLFEQISIGFIEIPFIILYAVYERKYGWERALLAVFIGSASALAMDYQYLSITPVVFLKVALMGVILGEISWFKGSFSLRLIAVAFPGFLLAVIFGVPLIIRGVSPEVMDNIKLDALKMYEAFMPHDDAVNTANNLMQMLSGFFKAGLAVFLISSFTLVWLSFVGAQFIMRKFNEEPEVVPPMYSFKLPFHFIWIFLMSFGFLLAEIKPFFLLALNIFVVMAFLYLIQGIAIVMYHMNRFSLGRFPRIIFWLVFFITIGFSGVFLIFAGLIDTWFSLRSIPYNNIKSV
ncbi:DUF2232 domain-containing protein [Candidatus Latescibacterota bacterium]